MDPILLIARIVHVVFGVFWAGTLLFMAEFLSPAMAAAGPAAGAVGAALIQRRFLDVLPVAAGLTLVSGFWLYWHASAGSPAYMGSTVAMVYGGGAILAVVGFILGMTIVRPSTLKAAALVQGAAGATGADRDRMVAEAQALRLRAAGTGKIVARLLGLTTVAMAVARYL